MKSIFSLMGEVVKGKAIQFIVWTLTFTVIFNIFANKGLSSIGNMNNDTFYTYNHTLDSTGMMILVIPAAIVSLLVMTVLQKVNGRVIASPISRKVGYSRFIETGGISSSRVGAFFIHFKNGMVWTWGAMKKVLLVFGGVIVIFMWLHTWITGGLSKSRSRGSKKSIDDFDEDYAEWYYANKKKK